MANLLALVWVLSGVISFLTNLTKIIPLLQSLKTDVAQLQALVPVVMGVFLLLYHMVAGPVSFIWSWVDSMLVKKPVQEPVKEPVHEPTK